MKPPEYTTDVIERKRIPWTQSLLNNKVMVSSFAEMLLVEEIKGNGSQMRGQTVEEQELTIFAFKTSVFCFCTFSSIGVLF